MYLRLSPSDVRKVFDLPAYLSPSGYALVS